MIAKLRTAWRVWAWRRANPAKYKAAQITHGELCRRMDRNRWWNRGKV